MTTKRLFPWLVLVCVTIMVCFTGSVLAASTGSVKGTAHNNSASGSDLSGVSVKCGGKSDTTDSKGKFEIKNISTGNQTISFSKSGYESFQTTVKIVAGKTANLGDRWLVKKVTTGSVSGTMHKNSASGAALSGVSVTCGGKSDTTDGNGNFKLDGITAGDYSVSYSKSGFEPFQTKVTIVADKNANIGDRWLAQKVTTGSVTGKVHKNSAAGSALSGVSVTCGGKSDTTDGSGNFKIDGVNAGDYSASFSKSGYEPFQTKVTIVADKNANIGVRWLTEKTTTNAAELKYISIKQGGDTSHVDTCEPQCVDFVKANSGLSGPLGNAKAYATEALPGFGSLQKNGSKIKPKLGDILVWSAIGNDTRYGHVALIKSVDISKGFLVRVAANEGPRAPWCNIKEENMAISGDDTKGYTITSPSNWAFSGWRPKQ